jgi:amino acid transporter
MEDKSHQDERSQRPKVFLRSATGLLRELSGWDGALIALSQLNILMGLMELWGWGAVTVHQANYGFAMLLSAPLVTVLALVWILYAIIMPRSGGEYVWISRGLSPALGFMTGFYMVFLALDWTSLNAWLTGSVFLPGFLFSLGMSNFASIVAQPINSFIVSIITIIVFTLLFIPRVKFQAKILWGLFLATFVGWIGVLIVQLFPTYTLATVLQTKYNVDPNSIINTAVSAGYLKGWTWIGTLSALPWAMQMWGGWWWAPYAGGEIRNPRSSMWIAVLGATYISIACMSTLAILAPRVFGFDLQIALNYLYATSPSSYPSNLPPPYYNYLVSMVTNNVFLRALAGWGFFASILFIIPSGFFVATRNFFAWSFDRVFPERLADVSERFHSPVKATIACGVLLVILAYLQAFTNFFGYLVNLMIPLYFLFILVSITAIIHPFKDKKLYSSSPISNWKFANIPALSWAGIGGLIVSAYLEYTVLTNPALGGPISWISVGSVIGVLIIGLIVYYSFKFYRKTQGVDLSLVFKEVPAE